MNIYIYSDESGVFDKIHNNIFVFGGLIILGSDAKELWSRLYASAENAIRKNKNVDKSYELKATQISNAEKGKLFRSLNNCYKFGVVVNQKRVLTSIFNDKKSKQRFLDYAYKIAVKRAFENLIEDNVIKAKEVERLYFYVDEHTTATNGCYELRESLEQEFKKGTYNYDYSCFFPPIFDNLKEVKLNFCNSKSKLLIRASDIVANKIFYLSRNNNKDKLRKIQKLNLIYLP